MFHSHQSFFSDPIACATLNFTAMPWVKCTCGLSFWGRTERSCKAQVQRHERKHVDEGDLELDNGPSTRDSCLFVILSHRHNHGVHTGCKAWLKKLKVPKGAICVVYGYKLHEDHHMGRPLKSNEILHYGVHHRWFPKVKELLTKRQCAGQRTTAVWFLEADARTEATMDELLRLVNGPRRLESPVRWLGWYQWRRGGLYQKTYGPCCAWQLQGSQCIVFTGESLQQMYSASARTGRYSHWDLLVWRSFFETGAVFVPVEPWIGTCGHYSQIMGKGQPEWRKGIEDAARKRRRVSQ